MKNKKLISLICAISMLFTMFTAFTASAADDLGIALNGSLSDDGRYVTVEATATGVADNVIVGFQLDFNVPAGVTSASQVSTTAGNSAVTLTPTVAGGVVKMNYLDLTDAGVVMKDGVLATVVFDLGEGNKLTSDYTATLESTANIMSKNYGSAIVSSGMTASTTSVAKWKDPNAKSESADRPTQTTEPASDIPTETKPDGSIAAIELSGSINDANNEITIEAKAVGVDDNLIVGFQLDFNVPAGITNVNQVSATAGNSAVTLTPTIANGVIKMNYLDLTDAGVVMKDGVLATVVFSLPEGSELTSGYYKAELADTSNVMSKNYGSAIVTSGMTKATAVVTPHVADKGTPTTVALSDYMGKDKTTGKSAAEVAEAYEADETKVQPLYITVDVTKENDNGDRVPAVYGTDYEAVYDGKTLTEAEYNNLIHGYTDDDISDVIKGLKFNVYNTAKNAKINTTLQAVGDDTQLVNDQETTDVNTVAPTYVASNIALKDSGAKTAKIGSEVTNTITVTPGSKNDTPYPYEVVKFKLTDASVSKLNLPGVQITYTPAYTVAAAAEPATETIASADEITLPAAVDGKYTVKFTAGGEGKVSYSVAYKGYDKTGVAVADYDTNKDSVTYTISAAADDNNNNNNNGGGGSSSSTKGGAIAGGYQGGTTGALPGVSFTDLGDVPWASTAINTLAMGGIVSGRSDTEFDPNANITRAEYCQILINAIGKQNDYADTQFNDVPTDAWFYHNVAVAAQLGIVSGYGDGNFGPYDLITREQMALMTQKAAKVMNVNLSGADVGAFADDADIADWSKDAVYELANAGIINGMGDGTFAPRANATRAQASVIIYNTFIQK